MKIYKVGGYVRDFLLDIPSNDTDYEVVGSSIEEMLALGYEQVGKDFPVFICPISGDEYALARKEISTGKKHTDFTFYFGKAVTLKESSERRDFTINALAMDKFGKIYDFHNGIVDLENKVIRHVNKETFVQDPLRLLRGARFAAQLDFLIAPETMDLFKQMVKEGDLLHLTAERVCKETEKAMKEGHNSVRYFEVLNECGALEQLFPEIHALVNTPEKIEWHPSGNTFKHTMIALDRVRHYNKRVKFMVLFHDLGKALTPAEKLPSHPGHDIGGLLPLTTLCDRVRIPNKYKKGALLFCEYHMRLSNFEQMSLKKKYDLIKKLTKFKDEDLLTDLLNAFTADWVGEEVFSPISECIKVKERIWQIFNIMKNKGLEDLSEKEQLYLSKYIGQEFYLHYRAAMVNYLRNKLRETKK